MADMPAIIAAMMRFQPNNGINPQEHAYGRRDS